MDIFSPFGEARDMEFGVIKMVSGVHQMALNLWFWCWKIDKILYLQIIKEEGCLSWVHQINWYAPTIIFFIRVPEEFKHHIMHCFTKQNINTQCKNNWQIPPPSEAMYVNKGNKYQLLMSSLLMIPSPIQDRLAH